MTRVRAVLSRLANSLRASKSRPFTVRDYSKWESDLKTYARTEYKKDWQFAFNYMLNNDGKAPKMSEWR